MKKKYERVRVQEMKRIPIRVSEEMWADICERADKEGKKRCRMIEEMLENEMNRYFEN